MVTLRTSLLLGVFGFGLRGTIYILLWPYFNIIAQKGKNETVDFIDNFPWSTWAASASNVVMMLATAHWFPWSFHLGHKLSRYWAFVCGCIAIIFSFGLWALMENRLLAWLVFTASMLLLHWPGWRFKPINSLNYVLTYVIISLPILAVFGIWASWEGDYVALAGVGGLYVVGGLFTIVFNILDKLGMSENLDRINHNKH